MFLAQAMNADRSCQNVVNEVALTRVMNGLSVTSCNTGSYCKARRRLPASLISTLTRFTGKVAETNNQGRGYWNGRPIRLIDGTTIELPDTEENRQAYPQTRAKSGCPLSRIVGVICLASGGLLNAAIGTFTGKGSGEQSLLRQLLGTFDRQDIVLGDAYYGTYYLLAELRSRQVDAVFEQYGSRKRTVDFRQGKRLGKNDHLVTYSKPRKKPDWMLEEAYDELPETITIRELKAGHKLLITTILSPKVASKDCVKNLYQQRWHIECDLRNIKTTLGMSVLTCKTPDMIEKEIWIYLLAYNLIRLLMIESTLLSGKLSRQLSFKHSLQLWRCWQVSQGAKNHIEKMDNLLLLVAENIVGNRPGRVEPRAVKRWRKSFPLLVEPREKLRKEIKLHGHPKKEK